MCTTRSRKIKQNFTHNPKHLLKYIIIIYSFIILIRMHVCTYMYVYIHFMCRIKIPQILFIISIMRTSSIHSICKTHIKFEFIQSEIGLKVCYWSVDKGKVLRARVRGPGVLLGSRMRTTRSGISAPLLLGFSTLINYIVCRLHRRTAGAL